MPVGLWLSTSNINTALSTHTQLASSVADMEALACLRAVQFATEIGLQRVIVEADSATIIAAVSQGLVSQKKEFQISATQ